MLVSVRSSVFVGLMLLLAVVAHASMFTDDGEFVRTPGGIYPKRCVQEVGHGSTIISLEEHTVVMDVTGKKTYYPKCDYDGAGYYAKHTNEDGEDAVDVDGFPSDYDGWLAYTSFDSNNFSSPIASFDTFLGNFSVPDAPASDPDVLFVFTGLQNIDWVPKVDPYKGPFDIIQPVLQYPADGDDAAGSWSVKSWYVTVNDGAFYSTDLPVAVGDVIFGNMTRLDEGNWFVGSLSTMTGQNSSITVNKPRLLEQPWAYTTVECYGCKGCETEPTQPILFTDMTFTGDGQTLEPEWAAFQSPNNICNTAAEVTDSATVTYTFGGSKKE